LEETITLQIAEQRVVVRQIFIYQYLYINVYILIMNAVFT